MTNTEDIYELVYYPQSNLAASLAGVFTWACTAAGARLVYFFNTINKNY